VRPQAVRSLLAWVLWPIRPFTSVAAGAAGMCLAAVSFIFHDDPATVYRLALASFPAALWAAWRAARRVRARRAWISWEP
jgi:hypothetical protein